jgi:hypothetical protein
MLNELEIIRLQSHLHSYLEFHPGVNIIRGTSHHGKSVLVRAIQWLLENEPDGTEFLNWYEDITEGMEVHSSFNEGDVSRIRNSKFNGYVVPHLNEEFEALRGHVPEEVRLITNMDSSNVLGQDDGYFLLRDTPGNVARKLNQKSGLEDIDKVAKIARSLLDEFSSRLKLTKIELKQRLERKEYLDRIAKHKGAIDEIDYLYKRSDEDHVKVKDLNDRITSILIIQVSIDDCKRILETKEALAEISDLLVRRLKIVAKYTKLRLTLSNINDIQSVISLLEKELESTPILRDMQQLINDRNIMVDQWKALFAVTNHINVINRNITDQRIAIGNLQIDITELKKELADIEICPTCGAEQKHWGFEIGE